MRAFLLLIWLAGSLLWLSQDHLIRDGDEEGHVGAAELLRLHLDGGELLAFAHDAWRGDLGEYPPLYPALVGMWWWLGGSGQPGAVPIRAINLLGLMLAAWATATLAARLQNARGYEPHPVLHPENTAAITAMALVLTLPLANGLARHFMPEGLLVGWVALSVLTATWTSDRGDNPSLAVLGVVLGLGMLIKQTFAPLAILPVVVAGAGIRTGWPLVLFVASVVAGPWYLDHWADQSRYVSQSVQAGPLGSQWAHLQYYPAALLHLIGGPVAVAAALVGAIIAARKGSKGPRRGLAIALAWLLGVAILAFIPKKYPRLAAPVAPALALLAGLGAAHLRRREVLPVAAVVGGTAWLVWTSTTPPHTPSWVPTVDEKCPQRWIRPANPDDMGLSAIVDALSVAPEGALAVAHAPEIPCAVQTTHPWRNHLDPYLRRAGIERDVVDGTSRRAAVQATFLPEALAEPGDVAVPSLELVLRIETR